MVPYPRSVYPHGYVHAAMARRTLAHALDDAYMQGIHGPTSVKYGPVSIRFQRDSNSHQNIVVD
jgi:hypothetical protein